MRRMLWFFCLAFYSACSSAELIQNPYANYKLNPDGSVTYKLDVLRNIIESGLEPNVYISDKQHPDTKTSFDACRQGIEKLLHRPEMLFLKLTDDLKVLSFKVYTQRTMHLILCIKDGGLLRMASYDYRPGLRTIIR
ncbi:MULTISPECIES: hypothetical protein [Klebsiella]|uniref:hypothetical protein n=1 Tax=Klebsiella TaxID=570 RepID=UPI0012B91F5F|nr:MULTISPECIES: hypothetical protein [Klebsiella]